MIRRWWRTAQGLLWMYRRMRSAGAKVRIWREVPGRFRLDAELEGDRQSMWATWNPLESRLMFWTQEGKPLGAWGEQSQ